MKFRLLSLSAILAFACQASFAAPSLAPATPAATTPAAAPAATFTPAQTAAIQKIAHDYIVQHPEVLIEASQALQIKQQQMMVDKAQKAIPALANQLLKSPTSPVAGNANGAVTVIEFFDYQCPHCKAMAPEIEALLSKNKEVRVIYKEMPIFGPNSEFAARAALASQKQGAALFDKFHNAILKSDVQEGQLTNQKVLDIAKSVGLDVNKLQADMNQPAFAKEVQDNMVLADKIGIRGTPAFIVINSKNPNVSQMIPGQTNEANLSKAIAAIQAGK